MIGVEAMRTARAVALSATVAAVAALYNRALAEAAEKRTPPRGRFLEIDGVRLHVVDRGRGDAIVLLHGNGAMVQETEATGLIERLSRDHRVIAIDRPGFGHSTRPRHESWTPERQARLVVSLLDRLGIADAIIIAHSAGVLVGSALAVHHRERVRGLVAVAGFFYPEPRLDQALAGLAVPIAGDAVRHTVAPLATRALAPLIISHVFAPNPVTPQFRARYPVSLASRPSQLRAFGDEYANMSPAADRLSRHYHRIACPVVILVGREDAVLDPQHHSIRAAGAIPGAGIVVVEGVGHMLTHIESFVVLRAVEDVERRAMRGTASGVKPGARAGSAA